MNLLENYTTISKWIFTKYADSVNVDPSQCLEIGMSRKIFRRFIANLLAETGGNLRETCQLIKET